MGFIKLLLGGLSIIGEAIKAFLDWKREESLRDAGKNENRLQAAERELGRVKEAEAVRHDLGNASADELDRELRKGSDGRG